MLKEYLHELYLPAMRLVDGVEAAVDSAPGTP